MAERVHNPFGGQPIEVPIEFKDQIHELCRTTGGNADRKPFERMIDLWFLALCLAFREGLDAAAMHIPAPERYKMIEGTIFDGDPWRIQAIMLICLARTDDLEILTKPKEMIALCAGLANAGLPMAIEMATEGHSAPIWNLSEALVRTLAPNR